MMQHRNARLLVIALLCILFPMDRAFGTPHVGVGKTSAGASTVTIELENSVTIPSLEEEEQRMLQSYRSYNDKPAETVLNFEGSHLYDNLPPLPDIASPETLLSFFRDPKERDYLHKGGGNYIENVPMTPELMNEWKAQAEIVQSTEPTSNDDSTILAIHSSMSLLPGLSIRAVSYMGCRLMLQPGSSLPVYELTLIKDDFEPMGAKPLVWLVNQVTNSGSGSSSSNRKTHSLTRISVHRSGGSLFLHYYGHVKVACSIPRRLMKLMPMSKTKMEETINSSIRKQIERESRMSLDPFRKGLERFLLQQG